MLGLVLSSFSHLFPRVARREMCVLRVEEHPCIPTGEYSLSEAYCIDPDCDCQRAMLTVLSAAGSVFATIGLGLDQDEWHEGSLQSPVLDPLNRQSHCAEDFLDIVEDLLDEDTGFLAMLIAHYQLVKEAAADPTHPIQETIADLRERRPKPFVRQKARVGRNHRCPCGSGRKHKRCCAREVSSAGASPPRKQW